jgi:histidine triad (HIT) family protein
LRFLRYCRRDSPGDYIFEDDLSYAILDINPFTQGHCLVLPKRHVPWRHELTEAETTSLFNVARIVANRMMQVFEPDFVMFYARGRRIPHIFLTPTYSGDLLDKYFNTLETIQESPVELAQLRAKSSMAEAAQKLREVE